MSDKGGFGRFLDLEHPFFLPAWRRAAVVALCLGWALVELSAGQFFWAILFGAAGAYAAYGFFVAWDPEAVRRKHEDKS